MSFKIIDNTLLKKNTKKYGRKLVTLANKEFDTKPVYGDNDKYIKAKIKTYGDKTHINFQGKKVPKENTPYI